MASNRKLNLIKKKDKETTERVCEDLLLAEEIREDVKSVLGREIKITTCQMARQAALTALKEALDDKLPESYEGENVGFDASCSSSLLILNGFRWRRV